MKIIQWIINMSFFVVLGLAVGSFVIWDNLFMMPLPEWGGAGRFCFGFYLFLCALAQSYD